MKTLGVLLALATAGTAAGPPAGSLFEETFAGGKTADGWDVHAAPGARIVMGDGVATIAGPLNAYAHLVRPLERDGVTAVARLSPSSPAGVSWCTSLFLVWGTGRWCQIGIISAGDGLRYYTTEMLDGRGVESYLARCEVAEWHEVRIGLARDGIRYYAARQGAPPQCLRVIRRPTEFSGPPLLLAVGKGLSTGSAPYAGPELDNDYADRGPQVTSRVAAIRVDKTAAGLLALTPAERVRLDAEAHDPVGQQVLAGRDDPTFERVARWYPAMQRPREVVGVPEGPQDIGVDWQGHLQLSSTPGAAGAAETWLELGEPPLPAVGAGSHRRLAGAGLPVVTLAMLDHGLWREQTVFGWSQGFDADAPLAAFVRLRVRADGAGPVPDAVTQVCSPGGQHLRRQLSRRGPREGLLALRIPFGAPERAEAIPPEEFERRLAETMAFWRARLAPGLGLSLPEQRVSDAWHAWLAYAWLNVDRVNGIPELHDGAGFYEEVYGYSAALYCHALDLYGFHDDAARFLDGLLHFQQPDGLYTQNFGLPDQGALLLALSEHYKLTGDDAWLQRVAPAMERACEWLVRTRGVSQVTGVTAGLIRFRPYCDYPEPTASYFGNAYGCVGLEMAADVLAHAPLGVEARQAAERYAAEARSYRAAILRSMDAAACGQGGRTVLPMEPDTRRLLRTSLGGGDYYGLVASCVLESGFLPAKDHRTAWVTGLMEDDHGLLAGLCRFGPGGVDHAYTYGYLTVQLARGEIRRFLLGFYGMLAYGMTRDTYSGVECTTAVSGANQATLPHLYSCTQQLRTLRMMLLREEGDTLRLGDGIPRAWLSAGRRVAVQRAPTHFGPVSFTLTGSVGGRRLVAEISPPSRRTPRQILLRLRHPAGLPVRAVRVNGRPWPHLTGEDVDLGRPLGRVRVEADYPAARPRPAR